MAELRSINSFVGDGARTNWEINFSDGHLVKGHVKVIRHGIFSQAVFAATSTVVITPPLPLKAQPVPRPLPLAPAPHLQDRRLAPFLDARRRLARPSLRLPLSRDQEP